MKIVRLKPGERAPDHTDRIVIDLHRDGRYGVSGIATTRDGDAGVFTIAENTFPSVSEAEAAGIRWAMRQPISVLHVERPQ